MHNCYMYRVYQARIGLSSKLVFARASFATRKNAARLSSIGLLASTLRAGLEGHVGRVAAEVSTVHVHL